MKQMSNKILLSVIIPLYNEQERVFHLKEVVRFLANQKFTSELIVVNDGSKDATLRRLEKMKITPVKLISYTNNRGKGYAIKKGMMAAKGEYRLFMDVDLSTPLSEIDKLVPMLGDSDVVIGTRKNKQANVLVRQQILRELMGRTFTWLSRTILGVKVSDFTCGFKCFSKLAAEKIFGKTRIERWGFDGEVLYLAKKYNLEIKEMPVTWINDNKTKVRFPQDIVRSFSELAQVLINDVILRLY